MHFGNGIVKTDVLEDMLTVHWVVVGGGEEEVCREKGSVPLSHISSGCLATVLYVHFS